MATSSNRGLLLPIVIATVIMAVIALIVYLVIPHKIAKITVQKVDIFAPHTEFQASQGGVQVLGNQAQVEDDLYVVPHLRITDNLHQRIIFDTWSATLTLADGSKLDSTLVARSEIPRLGQIFPQILNLATQPLGDGDELQPGVPDSGSIVLLFPNITQDQWNKKKSATLTLQFREHVPETINLP